LIIWEPAPSNVLHYRTCGTLLNWFFVDLFQFCKSPSWVGAYWPQIVSCHVAALLQAFWNEQWSWLFDVFCFRLRGWRDVLGDECYLPGECLGAFSPYSEIDHDQFKSLIDFKSNTMVQVYSKGVTYSYMIRLCHPTI
jgi:hypothetical protein